MGRKSIVRKSLCIGFAAAVMLSAVNADGNGLKEQVFLFPQFSSAAACDRDAECEGGEITYSFKLVEVLKKLFS